MPDIFKILEIFSSITLLSIILLVIVLTLLEKRWELKQRREVAERLGIEYHKQIAPADQAMFAKFALASRGHNQLASNVLVADSGELRMVIFDFDLQRRRW